MTSQTFGQTIVEKHGRLKVTGNQVVNQYDASISLAGNSLFWSQWSDTYWNKDIVEWLKEDWNSSIVRAAMGVEDGGGYIDEPDREQQKVETIVDAAIEAGIYVIIDWHSHHAEWNSAEAKEFFSKMAQKYGQYENVLFEIYNEPVDVDWTTVVEYAHEVIPEIRKYSDNVVIVGSPHWSQDVHLAGQWPIREYQNVAYALHFYSVNHKQELRDRAWQAMHEYGIALFVTEWGPIGWTQDDPETMAWMEFLKDNGISHCAWAVNNKEEEWSILKSDVQGYTGNWQHNDLSESGKLERSIIRHWSPKIIPGIIQAEDYYQTDGAQIENSNDSEDGLASGLLAEGGWVSYSIDVPMQGEYSVEYRVASTQLLSKLKMEIAGGGESISVIEIQGTGSDQDWMTVSHTVQLDAGEQNIALVIESGALTINWFSITQNVETIAKAGIDISIVDEDGSGDELVYLSAEGSEGVDFSWSLDGVEIAQNKNAEVTLPLGYHTIILEVTGATGDGALDSIDVKVNRVAKKFVIKSTLESGYLCQSDDALEYSRTFESKYCYWNITSFGNDQFEVRNSESKENVHLEGSKTYIEVTEKNEGAQSAYWLLEASLDGAARFCNVTRNNECIGISGLMTPPTSGKDSTAWILELTNEKPTAHAGDNVIIDTDITSLQLNGSSSFDGDNNPSRLTYLWEQQEGAVVDISDTRVANPLINGLKSGEFYEFALVVDDGAVRDTSRVSISVAFKGRVEPPADEDVSPLTIESVPPDVSIEMVAKTKLVLKSTSFIPILIASVSGEIVHTGFLQRGVTEVGIRQLQPGVYVVLNSQKQLRSLGMFMVH